MKRTTHAVGAALVFALCLVLLEDAHAQPLLTFGSASAEASAFGPNGIALGILDQSCSQPTCSVAFPAASRFGDAFSGSAFADISPSALSIAGHNTFGGAVFPPLENTDYSTDGREAFYAHVAPDAVLTIVLTTHFSGTTAGATVGLHDIYLGSIRTANAFAFGDHQVQYSLNVGSAITGPDGLAYYWVDTIKASGGVGLSGSTGVPQDGSYEGSVTIGIFDSLGNQLNVVSDVPEPASSALLLAGLAALAHRRRRENQRTSTAS
jgi:PEP-CTERM motif